MVAETGHSYLYNILFRSLAQSKKERGSKDLTKDDANNKRLVRIDKRGEKILW